MLWAALRRSGVPVVEHQQQVLLGDAAIRRPGAIAEFVTKRQSNSGHSFYRGYRAGFGTEKPIVVRITSRKANSSNYVHQSGTIILPLLSENQLTETDK